MIFEGYYIMRKVVIHIPCLQFIYFININSSREYSYIRGPFKKTSLCSSKFERDTSLQSILGCLGESVLLKPGLLRDEGINS